MSSRAVREQFDVRESFVVASDRSRKLEQMRLAENDLWVHLRESNVLTSTIYQRSRDDSLFLFFTEDVVATRPIYGALNLATAVGGSAAGLFALPFDRGELLMDGLRGVLVSLPELVFFNIRKGSNDYLESEESLESEKSLESEESLGSEESLKDDGSLGPRDRNGRVADAGSPRGSPATLRVAVQGD
jgi:hypothetical protein